jgi:hypothetical protein
MNRVFRSTLFWIGVALAFTVIGTVGAWLKYRQPHLLLVWKPFIFTQHQFDYELEFIKRGLVGEMFRLSGVVRTVGVVSVFSWGILVLLAALLVKFHRRFSAIRPGPVSPVWLGAIFVSPATFLQAGGDLGRLDPVLLVCQVGLLLQALATGRRWLPLALLLTWIGVATHELFLLAQLPLILAVHLFLGWHQPQRQKELWSRALVIAVGGVIAAWYIAARGGMEGIPANEYIAFLQEHRGLSQPNEEGVAVVYNSLGANISYAWNQLANKAPWGIPCAAAVMLAYLGLALATAGRQMTHLLLIAAGVLGPLLLLALAYDYGRWFSFATINILLAVSVCQQNTAVSINWRPLRWTWLFPVLGPFGVTIGFPWWL